MQHFHQLVPDRAHRLFDRVPSEFSRDSPASQLATSLGATLYLPAVRPCLAADIVARHANGVMSVVCCLEDAIRDDEVCRAETNLVNQLHQLAERCSPTPLIFIRVRHPHQIRWLGQRLAGPALRLLSGFVLPKFRADDTGREGILAVRELAERTGQPLYAMPILESGDLIHLETRRRALLGIRDMLQAYRASVLAVRVGVTDLCSAYGLRRPAGMTAWDIGVVACALADIINTMTRSDGTGFVVTGPVWEYFDRHPADIRSAQGFRPGRPGSGRGRSEQPRQRSANTDAFIREILLDAANGLTGKTIIHPGQASAVHAASVVSHEEFADATAIRSATSGGVLPSEYGNKMNEAHPHLAWAERTLRRAESFGVAAPGIDFSDILRATTAPNAATPVRVGEAVRESVA